MVILYIYVFVNKQKPNTAVILSPRHICSQRCKAFKNRPWMLFVLSFSKQLISDPRTLLDSRIKSLLGIYCINDMYIDKKNKKNVVYQPTYIWIFVMPQHKTRPLKKEILRELSSCICRFSGFLKAKTGLTQFWVHAGSTVISLFQIHVHGLGQRAWPPVSGVHC